MMELSEVLNVSKEQFFNQLLYSVQMEIQDVTKQKINIEDITSGFSYRKHMKTKAKTSGDVKVIIDKVIKNELYRMSISTTRGNTIVEYHIKELDSNQIEVRYLENFESDKKSMGWNYKLMSFFYVKKGKKRISEMLKSMETYILENQ
ncbi:MAG: DUF3284 domain-containing protein [Coprobacillaceae bacterium]